MAGDALLMRAYSLIQVSADMASEKTRERKLPRLMPRWPSSIFSESAIVTMDEQTDIPCEHGVVTLCPHGSGSLP